MDKVYFFTISSSLMGILPISSSSSSSNKLQTNNPPAAAANTAPNPIKNGVKEDKSDSSTPSSPSSPSSPADYLTVCLLAYFLQFVGIFVLLRQNW
jgi:hypothetical protein